MIVNPKFKKVQKIVVLKITTAFTLHEVGELHEPAGTSGGLFILTISGPEWCFVTFTLDNSLSHTLTIWAFFSVICLYTYLYKLYGHMLKLLLYKYLIL